MKFIHDHLAHPGGRAFAQGNVGEDFGGAAQDGRVVVDGGVAGAQADVVRAKITAKSHEFLIHQGLDGAGIDRAFALGNGLEMEGGGHEGFPGAGGGVKDDIFLIE